MTNLEALKGLYEKLGGNEWEAETISEGIAQVTEVANNTPVPEELTIHLTDDGGYVLDVTPQEFGEAVTEGDVIYVDVFGVVYPCGHYTDNGAILPDIPIFDAGSGKAAKLILGISGTSWEFHEYLLTESV